MKNFLVLLVVLIITCSCNSPVGYSEVTYDVTYSVYFGTSADVFYISENGDEIHKLVDTPWSIKLTFVSGDTFGLAVDSEDEVLVSVTYMTSNAEPKTHIEISDSPIYMYFDR